MKIVKKGRDVSQDVFMGTCSFCETEIECTRTEARWSSVGCERPQCTCPNCQHQINLSNKSNVLLCENS